MRKNTNSINLLPSWVKEAQQRRKTSFILAGLQAVIFLLIFAVLFAFTWLEKRAVAQAYYISETIRTFDPSWGIAAANVSAAIARQAQTDEFFELHGTYWFEPEWLPAIVNATPPGPQLIRMEYSNAQILLTSISADISMAGVHRREIAATGLFYSVSVGSIVGIGDGIYSYELRVNTHDR